MKYITLMALLGVTCIVLAGSHQYQNTLGRTHFIVGMTKDDYDRFKAPPTIGQSESDSPNVHKVLFSPDDDIHAELLGMIEEETKSIKMAMYLFTDKDIAQALRDAQLRGVCVECVTDASCISKGSNAMHDLLNHEIPVWVYRAANESKSFSNAMHHKFMIFGSSGKVVTGSLNITNAAQKNNQENIVILADDILKRKFDRQFGKLKTRCSRLMPQIDSDEMQ